MLNHLSRQPWPLKKKRPDFPCCSYPPSPPQWRRVGLVFLFWRCCYFLWRNYQFLYRESYTENKKPLQVRREVLNQQTDIKRALTLTVSWALLFSPNSQKTLERQILLGMWTGFNIRPLACTHKVVLYIRNGERLLEIQDFSTLPYYIWGRAV